MLFDTTEEYQERLKLAWLKFVRDEPFDYSFIRPEILESWRVSRYYRVAPYDLTNERLTAAEMEPILKRHRDLIQIARPEMERLYSIIRGSNAYILLTDNQGIMLDSVGDKKNLVLSGPYTRLIRGSSWNVEDAGTNSISLCLATKKPCQVYGNEHYKYHYKSHTCSGAPIFSIEGGLVGTINISALKDEVNIHTLGAMVTSAQTIEHALKLRSAVRELTRIQNASAPSFSFLGPTGLILLNHENRIMYINPGALKMLDLKEQEAVGQPLFQFMRIESNANSNTKAFLHFSNNLYDLPANIMLTKSPERPLQRNVSIHRIDNLDGRNYVTVLTLSPPSAGGGNSPAVSAVSSAPKEAPTEFRTTYKFSSIVGSSPAMLQTVSEARQLAQNYSNVLITGESGTGKELFAQAIHSAGGRKDRPFVAINCGAIPRSLVESELFGYEQGAFTGGKKGGAPGKFELANGGTLFLDEIGEMPPDTQVTLLRILEDRRVMRLGGTKYIPLDVRIIAATNRNLAQAIREKTFREDLYYRLNVLTIRIPPLRERRTDIIDLVHFYVNQFSPGEDPVIGDKVYEALMSYSWPGNVRELGNVIQRALLIREGSAIEMEHLPADIRAALRGNGPAAVSSFRRESVPGDCTAGTITLDDAGLEGDRAPAAHESLRTAGSDADTELSLRSLYISALKATRGNVQAAAADLKMNPRTFYRRLSKYDINPKAFKK